MFGFILLVSASLSAQWSSDRTPPQVTLSAPAAGAIVSGTVTLAARATDNLRVYGVQFYVDNVAIGYEDRYAPYSVTWDSTKATNATHTIRARARDYSGNTASSSVTVTVRNGTTPPPTCGLALTATVPATAGAGAAVSFSATGTPSNCSGTVAYVWTFGDGATANTRTSSHAYATAGSYVWSVRATVAGVTATKTGTIVVAGVAPCSLSVSATVPAAAAVNAAVTFAATATPSNCTGAVAYAWNFGDGATATAASVSHAYGSTGTYGWSVTASIGDVVATTSGGITVSAENLLFYDDFANGVDTVAWNVRNGPGDSSNSELQYYLPSNVSTTADGLLQIVTRQQSQSGYQYTSGMLYWRSFNFTYGVVEIRAKMAGGQGPWPALWMLGYMCQPGLSCNWPQPGSDEIDMTEILGSNHTHVNQQIHSGGNNSGCSATTTDVSLNWHTYRMIWSAGRLVWQIDGVTTCTVTSGVPSTPMFLIINTAVGGAGGSVNTATLPQTMLIDYVKITK